MTFLFIFFIIDNFSMVWVIKDGSLFCPLLGIGDKYGESVSTNNLFIGINYTASASRFEFLNVMIPLIDI